MTGSRAAAQIDCGERKMLKKCPQCNGMYANKADYCTPNCQLLAIKDRVLKARSYPHQPKHAMVDRDVLFKLLGPRI